MLRWSCWVLIALTTAAPAYAQGSPAAGKQAGSWFFDTHDSVLNQAQLAKLQDSYLKRMTAIAPADVEVWEGAAKSAGVKVSYQELVFALPNFKPLFDSKEQLVVGAVAKYAKRLQQIPHTAIAEWETLTGREEVSAAMSLTAEDSVFLREVFSDKGFRALVAKLK